MRMEDRNGNEVFVTSSGIIHENGRSVSFVRDAQGRITQIIDPLGETMNYVYDANDDLVSFTDRLGNTTTFEYGRDHCLEEIVDPRGVSAVRSEYDANGRLVATIDPDGNRIEVVHDLATRRETVTNRLGDTTYFDYDVRGNVVQETYPDSTFITRTFDLDDNITTMTDELGRTTTYTHDAYGNVLTESNALGETSTTTYTALGDVATVTDPRGAVTTYGHDGNGNLRFITDPEGNVTEMRYDNFGQVILEIDPRGFRRRYQYSGFGQISREVDERDVPTLRTYDANGVMLTETTTRSVGGQVETLVTTYVPDALGRVVQTTFPDGATTSMAYDEAGRVTERTDELGRVTGMVYNARGEQTRMNYPDGTSSSMTYDAEGRMLTRTDRGGRTRTMTYDSRGRMTTTVEPDNATTSREYDSAGQMVASIDPNGNRTEHEYDDAGRLALTRDALLNETTRTYDAAGSLASFTNAKGQVTTYYYDLTGLQTRVVYNDGSEERMVYDASGNVVTKYDAEDDTMTYAYDGAGLLTAVTDGRGDTWTFAYDELGNRISQTDPNNHTTSFGFDVRSRETARTLPDSLSETRTYDVRGNLSMRTSYSGVTTTTHGYDLNDRLISRGATDMATVSFGYTPTGRRDQVIDPRGLTDYGYDTRDRMTSISYPDGSSIVYTYDAAGNLATMQSTVGSTSWTETYGYNERNELTSVEVDSLVFTLSYDETGQVSSIAYPNGVTTTYTYDSVDRLASIVTANDQATVLASYTYTRYPDGNIETITEADGTLYDYAYDEANRLVQATVTSSTSTLVYAEGFAYDAAGNRSTRFYTPASGVQETYAYSYDSRDRIQSDGLRAYVFDADGRLLTRSGPNGLSLEWNSQNHLLSIGYSDGTVATNTYDPNGVLMEANIAWGTGTSSSTRYLVDARVDLSQMSAEIDVATGGVHARYVRAGNKILGRIDEAGLEWYPIDDHLGTTRLVTDSSGHAERIQGYDLSGAQLYSSMGPSTYAGHLVTHPAGPIYGRARWILGDVGAFLSPDPWDGALRDPMSIPDYFYAGQNALNLVDPTGRNYDLQSLSQTIGLYSGSALTAARAAIPLGRNLAANHARVLARAVEAIVRPGGNFIGQQIARGPASFLPGGTAGAHLMWERLRLILHPITTSVQPIYNGVIVHLRGGGAITLRLLNQTSRLGPIVASIEINLRPYIGLYQKFKFGP